MGRPTKYSDEQILDAAARLVVDGGAAALTASGVARSISAPSGSIYHRFPSRDHLAAALWLRTVERFDAEVVSGLTDAGDPVEVGVRTAGAMVDWARLNPVDAFVLTMFRLDDLTGPNAPGELVDRARALAERQRAVIVGFSNRLGIDHERAAFAVAGIPYAAVRGRVGLRARIPDWVRPVVEQTVRAALGTSPADESPSPEETRHGRARPH